MKIPGAEFLASGCYTTRSGEMLNIVNGAISVVPFSDEAQVELIPSGLYETRTNQAVFITGTGQILNRPHPFRERCLEGCCIHHPSDHNMRDFPTHFRSDRYMMERICPHGVGHPDPDHIKWVEATKGKEAASAEDIHGCDGCCHT